MKILDIMTPKVLCVYKTDSLAKATMLMQETKSHHLIVVEADGSLVGIISDRDCKQAIASPFSTFDERRTDRPFQPKCWSKANHDPDSSNHYSISINSRSRKSHAGKRHQCPTSHARWYSHRHRHINRLAPRAGLASRN